MIYVVGGVVIVVVVVVAALSVVVIAGGDMLVAGRVGSMAQILITLSGTCHCEVCGGWGDRIHVLIGTTSNGRRPIWFRVIFGHQTSGCYGQVVYVL